MPNLTIVQGHAFRATSDTAQALASCIAEDQAFQQIKAQAAALGLALGVCSASHINDLVAFVGQAARDRHIHPGKTLSIPLAHQSTLMQAEAISKSLQTYLERLPSALQWSSETGIFATECSS